MYLIKVREECVQKVKNPQTNDLITTDNNSDESDSDESDGQEEGPDVLRSLTLLDELSKCNALAEEDITALADVTKKLENLKGCNTKK